MPVALPSGEGVVLPHGALDLPALREVRGAVDEVTRGARSVTGVTRTILVAKVPRGRLDDLIMGEERRGNCYLKQRGPEKRGRTCGRVRFTCSRSGAPVGGKHKDVARRAQVRRPCSLTRGWQGGQDALRGQAPPRRLPTWAQGKLGASSVRSLRFSESSGAHLRAGGGPGRAREGEPHRKGEVRDQGGHGEVAEVGVPLHDGVLGPRH